MLKERNAPNEQAPCAVTGQGTIAGYRVTFSIDNVRSAEEGGFRHYALSAPGFTSGRTVDEFYEDPDLPGVRYETFDDVPAEKRSDLGFINRLIFRSVAVNERVEPGTVAASLAAVAEDIARDGRSGWLIWNPKGKFRAPVGTDELELARPCRVRIPGGESATQVEARIMLGGITPVIRQIELDGQAVTIQVEQVVTPPVGEAWDRIRAAREAGLR